MAKTKHILVIDDDQVLQNLLDEYFSNKDCVIHQSLDCDSSTKLLSEQNIDIVVLDVVMPGMDGLQCIRWIKDEYPDLPVIMLSGKGDEADRIKGLEIGADDYLTKPFSLRELELRIGKLCNIFRTKTFVQRQEKGFSFDHEQEVVLKGGKQVKLTRIEGKLLKIFMQNPEKTLSRDDLSIALHGHEHNPLDRSLDVHINHLRNKIEDVPASPVYLKTVWGKGYRFLHYRDDYESGNDDSD